MKSIEVVAAIIFNSEGKVLIARRKPGKKLGGKWELAGGKIEDGEEHSEALMRELREEFCIEVIVGKHFITTTYDYNDFSIVLHAYFTEIVNGSISLIDHDRIEWVNPEDFLMFDLAEADIPILQKLIKTVYH